MIMTILMTIKEYEEFVGLTRYINEFDSDSSCIVRHCNNKDIKFFIRNLVFWSIL
jgi:hypothetical protein